MKFKVSNVLASSERNSSVDVFRGIAIISVVLFHFNNFLPYGYLGVDLFFVISGLLVGGLLTKEFQNEKKINVFRFILRRGFKIWPSYYFFVLAGGILVFCFYHSSNPEQVIYPSDLFKYIFFYYNYSADAPNWFFNHLWTLCVEEHFYILLPVAFLIAKNCTPGKHKLKLLFVLVVLLIVTGIVSKHYFYFFTEAKNAWSGVTHNRIDALAWGVLLNLILTSSGDRKKKGRYALLIFIFGLSLFSFLMYARINFGNYLFSEVYFPILVPFTFFSMLMGLYTINLSKLKLLRVIAYYSYNWYLWHPVFGAIISRYFGNTFQGLLIYLAVTFFIAALTTIFIEEKFLEMRKNVFNKIFEPKKNNIVSKGNS